MHVYKCEINMYFVLNLLFVFDRNTEAVESSVFNVHLDAHIFDISSAQISQSSRNVSISWFSLIIPNPTLFPVRPVFVYFLSSFWTVMFSWPQS